MSGNQKSGRVAAHQDPPIATACVLLAALVAVASLQASSVAAQNSPFGSTRTPSRETTEQPVQEQQPPPAPIPTNQTSFGIPIVVHQHRDRIAEFQLMISLDRGKTWSTYQKRGPEDEEFSFQAQNDGEYWFSMRTIDRNRQVRPVGPTQPELVIAVDTEKPHLQFEVVVGQAGNVFTRWEAADPTLVPESFSLQYRASGGLLKRAGEWIDVPLKNGSTPTQGFCRGEEAWWPEIESGTIEVQATILDAAKNVAVDTRRIEIPKVARQLRPDVPSYNREPETQRRLANNERVTNWPPQEQQAQSLPRGQEGAINPHEVKYSRISDDQPRSNQPNGETPGNGMQSVTATTQPSEAPLSPSVGNVASRPQPEPGPKFLSISDQQGSENTTTSPGYSDEGTTRNPYHLASQNETRPNDARPYESSRSSADLSPTPNDFSSPVRPSSSFVDDGPGYETLPPPVANPPRFMPNDLRESNQPRPLIHGDPQESNPVVTNSPPANTANPLDLGRERYQAPPQLESTSRNIQQVALPPGEYALLTNRRQFRLTYEIDAVRPEAVDEVELWITRDGGNSWEAWANDPDRQSPFEVHVEEEGIYGFKIVVSSKEGFSGQTPRAGDLADIWVEVDMTSPQVEIKSAPLGRGPDAGKLVIQWLASDHKLAARPITLYYSESLEGPWNVIAAGLDNTGTYPWRVDASTPKMIFLRIEAEDKAGNSASHDLITPVDLRRLNPTGRIKGFDTKDKPEASSARMRRPFRFVR